MSKMPCMLGGMVLCNALLLSCLASDLLRLAAPKWGPVLSACTKQFKMACDQFKHTGPATHCCDVAFNKSMQGIHGAAKMTCSPATLDSH